MGCASSGDDLKELENIQKNSNNEKEENNKINKKNSKKDFKSNILETANSIDNKNSNLDKEINSLNLSKKDKTISSSKRQNEIKVEINKEGDGEIDLEKNVENFSLTTPRGSNTDEKLNFDNIKNNSKINFGINQINPNEKLSKRNDIKYVILEKEDENEENSDSKKNSINIDQYKDPKHNIYFSRNIVNNEISNTYDLNANPHKFIRRYTTSPKKFNTEIFSNLLLKEEKRLSLSFENFVVLQSGKPSKKYKIINVLGNGSYGKVYKAMNLITQNLVAIKSVKKKKDNSVEGIDIKNEIDVLKKLNHPNIVKIYEFYDIKDNYYLITELCKYGDLYNYIKFTFSEKQLCVLFYQVFSGLIYLHENKIIHRDLKLENIMIDSIEKDNITCEPYFYIKIIDFGSAKYFSKQRIENEIIGSSYYIAPEVLKQKYNEKCDTWSAGVLLYMLLTKKAPFNGKNSEIIMEKIEEGNYDRKNKKLMEFSDEVRDLLNHLLEKDVDKRFSAKQALNHPWFKSFGGRTLFNNFNHGDIQIVLNNLFNFKNSYNKIQELVLAFLVHNSPTTDETLTILKIFRYFNISGTCKLLKEELIEGLYKYKSKKEVDSMIEEIFEILDFNKCGYIEYEAFLSACIDKNKLFTKENLKYAFQFIDQEKSNGIDGKKIIKAFNAKMNKVLEAVFNNLIIKVDEDGDGIINFNEFQKLCLS